MDKNWRFNPNNRGYPWEPDADYEDVGAQFAAEGLKRPNPLQTIGDIFFDEREYNAATYAEYSQDTAPVGTANGHAPPPRRQYSTAEDHEEDAEGNPKTFKRVLVRFAERTSMQGVPYIYVSSVWYAKLGWSLLFLIGFGMMVAHLYLLIDEFYQYDTHSTVSLGFSTLTFPAVTICNVNPIKHSKLYLATPALRALVDAVQPSNIAGSMEEERNKKHSLEGMNLPPVDEIVSHLESGQQSSNGQTNSGQQSSNGQTNSGQQSSNGQTNSGQQSSNGQTNSGQQSSNGQTNSGQQSTRQTDRDQQSSTESGADISAVTLPSSTPSEMNTQTDAKSTTLASKVPSTTESTLSPIVSVSATGLNHATTGTKTNGVTEAGTTNPRTTAATTIVQATREARATTDQKDATTPPQLNEPTIRAPSSIPQKTTEAQTPVMSTSTLSTTDAQEQPTLVTKPPPSQRDTAPTLASSTSSASTAAVKTTSATAASPQETRPTNNNGGRGNTETRDAAAAGNDQNGPPTPTGQRVFQGKESTRRRRSVTDIHRDTVLRRYKRFIEGFSIEESNNRYKEEEESEGLHGNKSTIRAIEDEFRFLYSIMGREARQEMGHDIAGMLMECTFRGIMCSADQFRLVQTAQYGNCYTIENNRYISTVGGPDDGLTLYLFTQDEEYLHGITNSMGFQVHIHNIGEFPNPYSEGLSVSAGMETFIGLKKVNIERLKDPYGECVDNEDFESLYNIKYTQRTCQAFCLQRRIVEECSCFDAEKDEIFKRLADARMVDLTNATGGYRPCRDETESKCLRSQLSKFQNQEYTCECPSPCEESLYNKELSSKVWPTSEYANILVEYLCSNVNESSCETYRQKSRSELASSFLKMVVYYEDLNYENITEKVDYETFQFVSDVGGTIGLWIGLSMISFFEVIQFLYEIGHYVFYMKPKLAAEKAKRQKHRQNKHDVVHALKFINSNGLLPMSTAASKLTGSLGSAGSTSGLREDQVLASKHETGEGRSTGTGSSGTGVDAEDYRLLSKKTREPNYKRRGGGLPWYSEGSAGLSNPGFEHGDPLSGLRGLGLLSHPAAYLSARDATGVDTRDLTVEFASHKC